MKHRVRLKFADGQEQILAQAVCPPQLLAAHPTTGTVVAMIRQEPIPGQKPGAPVYREELPVPPYKEEVPAEAARAIIAKTPQWILDQEKKSTSDNPAPATHHAALGAAINEVRELEAAAEKAAARKRLEEADRKERNKQTTRAYRLPTRADKQPPTKPEKPK